MPSVDELMAELEATRRRLDEVTSKVASNDEKMRQTHRRELRLLQAETLDALIFALTEGLRVSYGLEHVNLTALNM